MAAYMNKEFIEGYNRRVKQEVSRSMLLSQMEDGEVKDWITELLAENEGLREDRSILCRKLGGNAFNPVHAGGE